VTKWLFFIKMGREEKNIMGWSLRRRECMFGAFFGAWLGGIYVLTSHMINQLFLPGIPLTEPGGSLFGTMAKYILLGAVFGIVISLPENRWLAAAIGGLAAAALSTFSSLIQQWGVDIFGSTLILMLIMFLPLTALFIPVALLVRFGIDSQAVDPARPYLWARRILVPLLLTLIVVVVGTLSLYSPEARNGFRYVDQMIKAGVASAGGALPEPLKDVKNFTEDARGSYRLEWSDRVETFFGPSPAEAEMSQFLIIARFQNGFAFACIFSENRPVPNCTNY
jgi:hypothetical protein